MNRASTISENLMKKTDVQVSSNLIIKHESFHRITEVLEEKPSVSLALRFCKIVGLS